MYEEEEKERERGEKGGFNWPRQDALIGVGLGKDEQEKGGRLVELSRGPLSLSLIRSMCTWSCSLNKRQGNWFFWIKKYMKKRQVQEHNIKKG